MTPQETEPDLPVSVWESLAEVWVDSGLSWIDCKKGKMQCDIFMLTYTCARGNLDLL